MSNLKQSVALFRPEIAAFQGRNSIFSPLVLRGDTATCFGPPVLPVPHLQGGLRVAVLPPGIRSGSHQDLRQILLSGHGRIMQGSVLNDGARDEELW